MTDDQGNLMKVSKSNIFDMNFDGQANRMAPKFTNTLQNKQMTKGE